MRALISSLVLIISLLSPYTWAAKGVAFVHGTGTHTNAYDDYWTATFVDSVREGLPDSNNYTVINCDFNQFMWKPEAAGCLAAQLTKFIQNKNIDDLVIITHSNGGNIIRWIESNPTIDARHPAIINAISEVIALAPSSLGTPLADAVINGNVFEKGAGWILGYKTDAVEQQQVSSMAYYNSHSLYGTEGRPALPKPFKAVVGTGIKKGTIPNPFSSDLYCGGLQYQVALGPIKLIWLDSCSDGFLNCSSQAGAGSVWFYDYQKTKDSFLLSHHQSRRNCFNLDLILRNHI